MKRCLDDVKRHDEETRRERIQYAEKMLQCLKTGPKQLESAYKLSNILAEQQQQRHAKCKQKQLDWHRDKIEGQQLTEQAVEWVENQKEHIRNYRRRCAQYKSYLQHEVKERERQAHEAHQRMAEMEEKELAKNGEQMQEVLQREEKNAIDRRVDRKNADFLSKYNIQQQRQSNSKYIHFLNLWILFTEQSSVHK